MNEQELMKAILEKSAGSVKFEEKNRLAEFDNFNKKNELVEFINEILYQHNVRDRIKPEHIRFYADFIGNILGVNDKKLSKIIFDKYFPKPKRQTYYHYTSFKAASKIIESNILKLFNLNKRFDDEEFTKFYEEHGMEGYKEGGTVLGIDCSNKSIMSEIFYMSLTGCGNGSLYSTLWKDFGDNGEGVRLEFEIEPKTDDFREVYYSSHQDKENVPLLKQLFSDILNKYNKP